MSSLNLILISRTPWYLCMIGMGLLGERICYINWASPISASFVLNFRHLSDLSALYAQRCVATFGLFLVSQMLHVLSRQSSCWSTELCHRGPACYGFRTFVSLMP